VARTSVVVAFGAHRAQIIHAVIAGNVLWNMTVMANCHSGQVDETHHCSVARWVKRGSKRLPRISSTTMPS
jgi:hypothetical protein